MDRIDFDVMMLKICEVISQRSTCLKNKVGSVIVRDGRIIATGFNGMLSGFKHCESDKDCPRWNIKSGTQYELGDCQHSESNAILFCAKYGIPTEGASLYVNSSVCRLCARNIISAGITKVIYQKSDYDGIELLEKADIECIKFDKEI